MSERAVLAIFTELLTQAPSAEAVDFVFAHPVLLSPQWHERFAAFAESLSQSAREEAERRLQSLNQMSQALHQGLTRYSIGRGPLEMLYARVSRGEVTEETGVELAGQPQISCLLSLIYVRKLSFYAEQTARNGEWRQGLVVQKLILSALEARRRELELEQEAMDFCATIHWLDIVARSVWDVPDGRLFRDAVTRGEALAQTIDSPDGFYAPGEMLYRLGVLHLDPYTSGRTTANYDMQWGLWQQRLAQFWTAKYGAAPDDAARIPTLKAALPKAADYLRRAAEVRQGARRGVALKALLQALVWQHVAGEPPDSVEVQGVGGEARSLLKEDRYASQQAEIENLFDWDAHQRKQQSFAEEVDISAAECLLEKPISEWLEAKQPFELIDLFTQTAGAVREKAPGLAMNLWLAVLPLMDLSDEQQKNAFFQQGVEFVKDALVPAEALKLPGQTITEQAEAAEQLARSSGWDDLTRAAVLFSLALDSTISNEEEAGLQVLGRAIQASEELASVLYPLLVWVQGMLQIGAAVNALNQGKVKEAAEYYMKGAATFVNSRQPQRAMELIRWTVDLGLNRDPKALRWFVVGASTVALELEDQLGDAAMLSLQYYYRQVLAGLVQQKLNPLLLLFLLQAAKGNRLAHALARGGQVSWLATPEAEGMLREIGELYSAEPGQESFSSKLDEEMLLTAYVSPREMRGGKAAVEQLRNLQIRFDTELNRALLRQRGSAPEWIPTIETLQQALGPRSVLLCYFIGSGPKAGGLALFMLVLTNQEVRLLVGESSSLPSASVTMSDEEESVTGNWLSLDVQALREAVQVEPGPRSASGEALEKLSGDVRQYLGGGLAEVLASLRETGKDHLCIAPHGPLHYYPFHLLGPEDEPLFKSWSITYLPNLCLLDPARKNPVTKPQRELTAIGLGFEPPNRRALPPLKNAEVEAFVIAAKFGTEPLTGDAATKSAVLEAFAASRRIHLASHGRHRVSAPAFQCVYLSGPEGEDVLYSYDLLRLDLRGVELVTLSACETALGRFDVSDNLRGFSASLLIAGVATIIGTLWRVETQTAAFFFERLYEALHEGSTTGYAFQIAQAETRDNFPQYRDWGAFYLAGNWA
jgi:hypothetical protein